MHTDKSQKLMVGITLLLVVTAVTGFTLAFSVHYHWNYEKKMIDKLEKEADKDAENAAKNIIELLNDARNNSESLSSNLSSVKSKDQLNITNELNGSMKKYPELYGVAVAYKPGYDSTIKLYASYYVRKNGEPELTQIEDEYDYNQLDKDDTSEQTIWSHISQAKGHGCWIEPYFGTASDTFIVVYNSTFNTTKTTNQKNTPAVVTASIYSLDRVRNIVCSLKLGTNNYGITNGYGIIFTKDGTIVSHPRQDYLGQNIEELNNTDKTLYNISQKVDYNESVKLGNDSIEVIYKQINLSETNWTLAVVFANTDEISKIIDPELRKSEILITVAAISFLFFLITLLLHWYKGVFATLWILVISFSILCIIGTASIWFINLNHTPVEDENDLVIYDRVGLEAALKKLLNETEIGHSKNQTIRIPTGVYLQSIKFSGANDVIITGYIWQDYSGLYLFNWDEIPGKDNDRFIKHLEDNYNVDVTVKTNIPKSKNNNSINVSSGDNFIKLVLNNTKIVDLTTNNNQKYTFISKREGDDLKIYSKSYLFNWDEIQTNQTNNSEFKNFVQNYSDKLEIEEVNITKPDNNTVNVTYITSNNSDNNDNKINVTNTTINNSDNNNKKINVPDTTNETKSLTLKFDNVTSQVNLTDSNGKLLKTLIVLTENDNQNVYSTNYLFTWNKTPEKNNDRFKEILRKNVPNTNWLKTGKIEKNNEHTINVSSENLSILFTLNDDETKAFLTINDNITDEFNVITENGKPNIYLGISRGVIFPEAENIEIKEAYDTGEIIGWYFKTDLRQPFDYSKYPFDRENIWIRFWPEDFHHNIILTPDLNSYLGYNPEDKENSCGLEEELVLEGWDIQNSYFSYEYKNYSTTFGIDNYQYKNSPELYFNIGIKRDFMSPFISNIIPLGVVAFLLFAVLTISTKDKKKNALYGFNSSSVLGFCAALFFVLIISHISLRDKLAIDNVIYLEYFYFIFYFAILAVSINSVLLASCIKCTFVQYGDNLIVKLLYWPVISGLILGITLYVFY